jgi:hypothetical protein
MIKQKIIKMMQLVLSFMVLFYRGVKKLIIFPSHLAIRSMKSGSVIIRALSIKTNPERHQGLPNRGKPWSGGLITAYRFISLIP